MFSTSIDFFQTHYTMKRIANCLESNTIVLIIITTILLGCTDHTKEDESEYDLNCVEGMDVEEFYFYGTRGSRYCEYKSGDIEVLSKISSSITLNNDQTFSMSISLLCDSEFAVPICEEVDFKGEDFDINLIGTWHFTQTISESIYGSPFDGFYLMKGFKGEVILNVTESSLEDQIGSAIKGDFTISCVKGINRSFALYISLPVRITDNIFIQF